MGLGDGLDDGQAEPRSVTPPPSLAPAETIEKAGKKCRFNDSLIFYGQTLGTLVFVGGVPDLYQAVLQSIFDCVTEEVLHCTREQLMIGLQQCIPLGNYNLHAAFCSIRLKTLDKHAKKRLQMNVTSMNHQIR